jgi:hypothetical protein
MTAPAYEPGDFEIANVIASLAARVPGYPSPLADEGFEVWGVEREIRTTVGTAQPDVGMVNRAHDHTLLFECKGGLSRGNAQVARYSAITTDNYIAASFTIGDLSTHSHQVVYGVAAHRCARVDSRIRSAFTIVSVGRNGGWRVCKFRGGFDCPAAARAFATDIELPAETPQVIRFHQGSVDVDVAAGALSAVGSHLLRHGTSSWSLAELVQATLEHEPGMARVYGGPVRARVSNALRHRMPEACDNELAGFLAVDGNGGISVLVGNRDPANWLRRFQAAAARLIDRLSSGLPPTAQFTLPFSGQLDLPDVATDDEEGASG